MSLKTRFEAARYLIRIWATALPRILYRTTLSIAFDPNGTQQFLQQVLNAQDIEFDDPILGSVNVIDLVKSDMEPKIIGPYYNQKWGGTNNLLELSSIAYFIQALQPQTMFEIGTFIGRTTRLLAYNAPPEARIFTLDLRQEEVSHNIGEAFRGKPESQKITQLYGDTRTFDYSRWFNQCDFVWVDACHDYPYVKQDTEAAMKLCRSGGWVLWHDYRHTAWWSGVTRAVRELAKVRPGVHHLRGTTIAALQIWG